MYFLSYEYGWNENDTLVNDGFNVSFQQSDSNI